MKRLWCLIGRHDWIESRNLEGTLVVRRCTRCREAEAEISGADHLDELESWFWK